MSKRSTGRHAAESVSAVDVLSQNAGNIGRSAAVVAAASGLIFTMTPAAQAAQISTARESAVLPATGVDIERASKTSEVGTVKVAANTVKVERKVVTTEEAPVEVEVEEELDLTPTTLENVGQQQSTQSASTTAAPAAQPAATAQQAPDVAGRMGQVVSAAYSGIGRPYVFGGKTPAGWDCSGFTAWAYAQAGISIPSQTSAIRNSGKFVRTSNPQPGDLVFQNGGGHVGIYVGNGQMIGAQNPSVGTILHSVSRNPLYGYYTYVG